MEDFSTRDFTSFIARSFEIINPGTDYEHNWHIELLSEYLQAVERGEIKRLIINLPPRHLKSNCVSAMFPAWILGKNPTKRVIVASYSGKLSLRHSMDTRMIMKDSWYKSLFPESGLADGANTQYKFSTVKKGYRFATSVGGTLTGEGGDILIADDPHNPVNVFNPIQRSKVINWFEKIFASRLNDRKNGAIIIVMQRLHANDLSGYLLKKNQEYLPGFGNMWHHLNLPFIAPNDQEFSINSIIYKRTIGDLLHSTRNDAEETNIIRREVGEYAFTSQYQQNPEDVSNSLLKKEWFKRYKDSELPPSNNATYLSIDPAMKMDEDTNYTAATVWRESDDGKFYLIDVVRKQLDYPDLKKITMDLVQKHRIKSIIIEDSANGVGLIQDLKLYYRQLNIIPIRPKYDKVTRLIQVVTMIESGQVYLPIEARWLEAFESEIFSFPQSKYNDQMDSLTQFLNWKQSIIIQSQNIFVPRIRSIF